MNWIDKTIFIGDNLHVMRGMNSDSVDLIYLDPPFNSNRNYAAPIGSQAAGAAFKDTWTLNDIDIAEHGELAEQSPPLHTVIQAARDAHGKGMQSYLIMMSTRLLEMKRILKGTGSIYLHCDPTASHYLKLVMDSIFGAGNFRNEITWKRQASHSDSKGFGRITDIILFYGAPIRKDAVRMPLSGKRAKEYNKKDAIGWYTTGDLTAKGLSGGRYTYEYHGHYGPWRYLEERIRELEAAGRVYFPNKSNGVPRLKRYLHENKGVVPNSIWTDIPPVQSRSKEKTGYPTQKPLALLERIIKASSNPGDVVFDPFCGCATTLVAADRLQRSWVGIDISPRAAELVVTRIEDDQGLFQEIIARDDYPQRTDMSDIPPARTHKHTLYGLQEGICGGCEIHFPFRNLTIDHKIPRSRGGTDHFENLWLLCGACNSMKGTGTVAELRARLERG